MTNLNYIFLCIQHGLLHWPRPVNIKLVKGFLGGCVKYMQNKQSGATHIFSIPVNSLFANIISETFRDYAVL